MPTIKNFLVVSRSRLTEIGGVMIHRIEPQIQEVETRQGRYWGKGIVVHQAIARQVQLPGQKIKRQAKKM